MGRLSRSVRVATGAGLGVGAAFALPASAHGTINPLLVQSTGDALNDSDCDGTNPTDCTLREAIADTNDADTTDQDVIAFSSTLGGDIGPDTITLAGTQLPLIDEPLSINASGAAPLTIDANGMSRIFDIDTATENQSVYLRDLTLTGGKTTGTADDGGAIRKLDAFLTISDSEITGSSTSGAYAGGGAVYSNNGDLIVTHSTISGNHTSGYGSGASASGGGVHVRSAPSTGDTASILHSTISGNYTTGKYADGGGLFGYGALMSTFVYRSTIYDNEAEGAQGDGGGINQVSGQVQLDTSTVSGNTASRDGGGVRAYYGGGVVKSSTITQNGAGGSGGGVFSSPGSTDIDNSIVANNTAAFQGADLFGNFSSDFNLVEAAHAGGTLSSADPASNITGQDPELGPLQNNGGETETHKPGGGSAVIDQGTSFGLVTADQRGLPRPFDTPVIPNSTALGADGTDIGAVELQSSDTFIPPSPPGGGAGTAALGTCAGQRETSTSNSGTPGRDVILGTSARDVIRGLGGNDLVCGGGGNDLIVGGGGKDILRGEAGKDTLKGGAKKDKLIGGGGKDTLIGGGGPDVLNGGPGADVQRQ